MSAAVFDRYLRQLVAQGREHGGYITYQTIVDTLRGEQCSVSLDALDSIYERLTAEGISIVDELPAAATQSQLQGSDYREVQIRAGVTQPGRRRRHCDYLEAPGWTERVLCPEKVLDQVILRAEKGALSREDLMNLVEAAGFSALDVIQMVEYLWSKGIDIPDVDLSKCFRTTTEDRGTNAEENWEICCPTLEHWYRKLIERRG